MRQSRQKTHELQWLELLEKRGTLVSEEFAALNRLSRGYYGEMEFDRLCSVLLSTTDYYLNDITLKYNGTIVQIDKIIFAKTKIYVIDMKYYFADFTYKNSECYVGNKKMQKSIVEQLKNAVRLIENILYEANIKKEVQGVLAFMNSDYTVNIKDNIDLTVLEYHETMSWISQLNNSIVKDDQSAKKILNHRINGFKTRYICNKERFASLKKGLLCENCGKNLLLKSRFFYHCECGEVVPLEKAVLRIIFEVGTINHHKNLVKNDVKVLMGTDYKERYVRLLLKKHFKMLNKGRYASYENLGIIYDYYKI